MCKCKLKSLIKICKALLIRNSGVPRIFGKGGGHTTRGAGAFFPGRKISKKGTPTKADYSNHVAIKLAYSLKKRSSVVVDLQVFCFHPKIIIFSKKKRSSTACFVTF